MKTTYEVCPRSKKKIKVVRLGKEFQRDPAPCYYRRYPFRYNHLGEKVRKVHYRLPELELPAKEPQESPSQALKDPLAEEVAKVISKEMVENTISQGIKRLPGEKYAQFVSRWRKAVQPTMSWRLALEYARPFF